MWVSDASECWWARAVSCFGVEVRWAREGWTEGVFRLYYLTGAILVVPYLAVGELLLVAPGRRATRLVVATMLWVTFASTAAVLAAQVDLAELARAGAAPPNGAMGGPWTTILAAVLNTVSTLAMVRLGKVYENLMGAVPR